MSLEASRTVKTIAVFTARHGLPLMSFPTAGSMDAVGLCSCGCSLYLLVFCFINLPLTVASHFPRVYQMPGDSSWIKR